MSSTKSRPTLDSLSSRFARKDTSTPAPAADAAESVAPATSGAKPDVSPASPDKSPRAGERDARVQILTRIDPATRKRLKMIAVEQDRTIQDICEQAIRDFVARHSK